MPNETFKSDAAYHRWNAYRHIHGIAAPNLETVTIKGKKHKVKHSKLSRKPEGKLSDMAA